MADNYSDDDPDAAAMAEAMGFTGFGMQRGSNKKRKLPTPPSQTGANNAPLGKRRLPMNLPKPVVSTGGDEGDGAGGDGGNPEEIDLDGDDDGEGGVDVDAGTAGEPGGDEGDIVNERAAALTVDDGPSISGHQQHHHSLPPRPQQQQQHQNHHHAAQRHGGRGPGGQTPWWEGAWDPRLISRMIENPWDRLEKQRGLEVRGTWPPPAAAAAARGSGGGPAAAVASHDNHNDGEKDVSNSGDAATARA